MYNISSIPFIRLIVGLLVVAMLSVMPAVAKGEEAGVTSEQSVINDKQIADPFGRNTPRSALQNFIKALAQDDAALAANYLSLDSGDNAVELVRQFKKALDTGGRLAPELQISNDATGSLTDQLPPDAEQVGVVIIQDSVIDLMMQRKTAEHGNQYWQFSSQTVEAIQRADISTQSSLIDRYTIEPLADKSIGGYKLVDIVAVLLLALTCLVVFYVLIGLIYLFLRHQYPKVRNKQLPINAKVILPLALVLTSVVLTEVMVYAGVSVTVREPVNRIKDIIGWFALTWLLLRVVDAIFNRAERQSYKKNQTERVSILSLARKIVKALLIILATIFIFGNLGFDLTTGIAALGVGGLALALGAQKLIENLVGSVVVVADQPVRVGDYCKFGVYEGTVIDVGIRSTRVRTLDRTVVTVPNGEFSSLQIENFTQKDMFQFKHELYLSHDCTAKELQRTLTHLNNFIENHELTNSECNQVKIAALRQDCVVVEVRCYVYADGAVDFFDKQTQLIIEVLAQLEQQPVKQALPTQQLIIQDEDFGNLHRHQPDTTPRA